MARHRHVKRRPRRHRLLAGVVALALLSGLGIVIDLRAGRHHPAAASPSRHAHDRASRGLQRSAISPPSGTAVPRTLNSPATRSPSATPNSSVTPGPSVGPHSPAPTATAQTETPAATAKITSPAATPSGQRDIQAYVTGYSYFDNTPPGSVEISDPVLHQSAGGTGTYPDPITVAVGHSLATGHDVLDWPAGTRFYIPNLRRYFIAEDTCGDGSSPQDGPCHVGYPAPASTWLDIWVGGEGGTAGGADSCMNSITSVWQVLVNPAAGYATASGGVYGSGGCAKQYGNALVAS